MIGFLIRLVAVGLGLWVAWKIVPGIAFDNPKTLVLAALLLGLANAVVRPILAILTLPLTIVTLGLWLIVLNAAMIGLVAYVLDGFIVQGFVAALLCWLVVTAASWVASSLTGR